LLSKPYTREALARKIRHVITNQRQRAQIVPAIAPERVASRDKGMGLVLLVEDDNLIHMNTAEMLEGDGYVVVEAPSAEEAMTVLETADVDILLADVNLPGMSGPKLAAKAREIQPEICVVFATGKPNVELGSGNGKVKLIVKPYDLEDLRRALQALAGPRTDGDELPAT